MRERLSTAVSGPRPHRSTGLLIFCFSRFDGEN
ncbi:hypothetical protein HGI09_59600 [Streptomyces collinus]|nr:hypothetical protein HGI10_04480 [Streptomyces collinus]UJA12262.1 hypothetical protein HGI10_62440 [Streptomyces collinus]UJA12872.1 hypothetical protein HGI09_01660 [Streptomyces collinus]UJA18566.1 hypothetical protein HGI09_59600 [Streptomyces collinus]